MIPGTSALAFGTSSGSRAADEVYGVGPGFSYGGVPCAAGAAPWAPPLPTAEYLPWPSVWLGRFSGGRPYFDGDGVKLIDWRDEKVCFPSRRACQAWIKEMRRAYHRPEGYWTCLILR